MDAVYNNIHGKIISKLKNFNLFAFTFLLCKRYCKVDQFQNRLNEHSYTQNEQTYY